MDLSDDQVAEVMWASSDDGKAQLSAAWAAAVRLRLDDRIDMAEVGALLWAAHLAGNPGQAAKHPPGVGHLGEM